MAKGLIELEEMRFWAFHGCLETEKRKGNLFLVDFKGELDMTQAVAEDRLDNITNGENTTIKVIENGQLIIIRNGEKFNAQGVRL